MSNPLVHAAADVLNAYAAVKRRLGTHTMEPTRDGGLKFIMPGRPTLTLTLEDAQAWAQDVEAAEHG